MLSCEHLFRELSDGSGVRLKSDLERFGASRVEVAVYLRRPSARYLSRLQQALKTGRGTMRFRAQRYRGAFRSFEAPFGKESLRPKVFDRTTLPGGDVITDFVNRFLAAEGVDRNRLTIPRRVNETMSAESMQIFAWFHRDFGAKADFATLQRRLRTSLPAPRPTSGRRPRLRQDVADMVDYSTDETLWLRNKRGLAFPGYGYARIERGDLSPKPGGTYALADLVAVGASGLDALLGEVKRRSSDRTLTAWVAARRAETGV